MTLYKLLNGSLNLVEKSKSWPSLAILGVVIASSAHDVLLLLPPGRPHDVRPEHHVLKDGPGESLSAVTRVEHAGVILQLIGSVRLHPGLVIHALKKVILCQQA